MSLALDELARFTFQKQSWKDCSLHELHELSAAYPFFTPIQLLLAKRLEGQNGILHRIIRRASLFFPDPVWLDHLLRVKGNASVRQKEKSETTPGTFEPSFTAERTVAISEMESMTGGKSRDSFTETENVATLAKPPYREERIVEDEKLFPGSNELREYELPKEDTHPAINIGRATVDNNADVENKTELPVDTTFAKPEEEEVKPIIEQQDLHITKEEPVEGSAHVIPLEKISPALPPAEDHPKPETTAAPLAPIAPLRIEQIDPASTEISFEPFHTVDYFASQGIKFTEDEKPKDKFGQQLKSFTEWLKMLKKTPATVITSESPQAEQKVEKLAAISLADREVVTEAMAEVWEKQGNKSKALAIYEKLSLLDPSKSSYFAAKIDQLKNT